MPRHYLAFLRLSPIAGVLLALLVGACAETATDEVPLSPDAPASESLVVAEFFGEFDPASGTVSIRMTRDTAPVQGGLVTQLQSLYCAGLPSGDVIIGVVPDSVAFTVEECVPTDELVEWGELRYGDGAFCLDVELGSEFALPLLGTSAEITSITPGYEGYQFLTDDPVPCCGTGADAALYPEGLGRPTDLNGGLFLHGNIEPGGSSVERWVFRNADGAFSFSGRIVARIAEIEDGLDNDCDGIADEGLDPFEACLDQITAPPAGVGLDGAAIWRGELEFGQTHVIRSDEDRHAPVSSENRRTALFFVPTTPHDGDTVVAEVFDTDGELLGVIPLAPPGSVSVQESRLTEIELDAYQPDAWFGVLPWQWMSEGNRLLIGYSDGDEAAAFEHTLTDLGAPTRFTITRTKIVLFGEPEFEVDTEASTRIARDFFATLPVAQLRWVDALPWRLDYMVIRSETGPQRVESEAERLEHTAEDHWSILKHQVALRLSLANTGRGLAMTDESEGDSSPYSFGTSIGMGWFRNAAGNYIDIDDAPWAAGWTGWTAMWASECGNGFIHEIGHSLTMSHFIGGTATAWGISDEYPLDGVNLASHPFGFDTTTDEARTWYRVGSSGPATDEGGALIGKRDPMNGGESPNAATCFPQYTGYHAQRAQNWITATPTLMNVDGVPGAYAWNAETRAFEEQPVDERFGSPVAVDVPTVTMIGTLGDGTDASQTYPGVHSPSGNVFSLPDPSDAGLSASFDGAVWYLEIDSDAGTERALISVAPIEDTALRLFSLNLDARTSPGEVRLYESPTGYPDIDFDGAELIHTRTIDAPIEAFPPIVTVGRGAIANGPLTLGNRCEPGFNCASNDVESFWRSSGESTAFLRPGDETTACGPVDAWSSIEVELDSGEIAVVHGQRVVRMGGTEIAVPLTDVTPWLSGPLVSEGLRLWLPFEENRMLSAGRHRSVEPLVFAGTSSAGSTSETSIQVDLSVVERIEADLGSEFTTPGVDVSGTSLNFLVRDPAVGPTSRVWWDDGLAGPVLLRVPVLDALGEAHTLVVAAANRACGSTWDFHAGRSAGDCTHVAVFWVRLEDNSDLVAGVYATRASAPVVVEARQWHAPGSGALLDQWAIEFHYEHLAP